MIVIGPEEKAVIASAIAHAKAHPVPLAVIKAGAIADNTVSEVKFADRKPGFEATEHLMLGDVCVAYSVEEQPIGLCGHLSVSVAQAGQLPSHDAVQFIVEAFGFTGQILRDAVTWLEEFEPGHQAVNVVWVLLPYRQH